MGRSVFTRTVDLPATPDRVFWDLLDPSNVPDYDSRMRSWVPRGLPPGIGTRVDFEAKVGPVWMRAVSEFVSFDAPHHLELRQVSPPTPFRSRLTWDLVPTEGGTSFTYRFELSSPPGLDRLGAWLLGQFTSHLAEDLPALAERYR